MAYNTGGSTTDFTQFGSMSVPTGARLMGSDSVGIAKPYAVDLDYDGDQDVRAAVSREGMGALL